MKKLIIILSLLYSLPVFSQDAMPVTDSTPVIYNGFKAGYSITGASEKEVGNKGNFSRYKIKFYVTNAGSESKIFIKKQGGFFASGSASDRLVEFKCANATGARLTNKNATLQMQPCVLEADVEDKECGTDKTVRNRRLVNIGFWIKPGETITTNAIMIVPLNERPSMTVTFFPQNNGTVVSTDYNGYNNNNTSPGFVRLKNYSSNTYIHNQNGPVSCSSIDFNWWSAQWELFPSGSSGNYLIRNRWKNNYLTTDNSSMLTDDSRSPKALWIIRETSADGVYYIQNAADNSKLIVEDGILKIADPFRTNSTAQWLIER